MRLTFSIAPRMVFKRFKNVPFASLWLGTAIDSLLDHRRKGEIDLSTKTNDEAELVRVSDAIADDLDDDDDGDDDLGDDDDSGSDI